jgi:hypothetical protein
MPVADARGPSSGEQSTFSRHVWPGRWEQVLHRRLEGWVEPSGGSDRAVVVTGLSLERVRNVLSLLGLGAWLRHEDAVVLILLGDPADAVGLAAACSETGRPNPAFVLGFGS